MSEAKTDPRETDERETDERERETDERATDERETDERETDERETDERETADERATNADETGEVLAVHFGRAASCSSVGSVVDVLFLSTVAGAAVLSSLAVLLARRDGTNEGDDPTKSREDRTNEGDSAARDDDGETNETGAPRATKPKEGAPR